MRISLKNIRSISVIIVFLVFLSGCAQMQEKIKIAEKKMPITEEEAVKVGYGWSTKDNIKDAVQEAIINAKDQLKGTTPEYALLFSTVGYDSEELLKEIKQLLPNTQIYGSTSMFAVMTKDGFHQGETGSLALMAISSPKIKWGVGGANIDEFSAAREAGKEAITAAIKNAGKEGQLPKLVLMTAAPGKEEEILLGIEDIIGKNVPVIGGSSGDNDLTGKWKQWANNKVYSNGISLTVIFTDLKVGWAYEAGYLRTEHKGIIRKAEGRIIYEIDNKPAAEVYNEWTGGIVEEELKTGGSVLSKTAYYPLAKVIQKGPEIYYLSIHPLSVNLPEKSLTVFANVKGGDEVLLMHGNWELLLNRAQTTPHTAMITKSILPGEPYFGIYDYCAGTMLAIPEEERPKIPLLINNELGDIPFIGTFTFGEQGPLGIGNHHGNLINSMIVFAPE